MSPPTSTDCSLYRTQTPRWYWGLPYSQRPAGDLLLELHWHPVQSRISFKIACLTCKILPTGQPNYMRALLQYISHYTLCSLNQHLLEQPWVSGEYDKQSFSYIAPKTWKVHASKQGFPLHFETFKHCLKTNLFG